MQLREAHPGKFRRSGLLQPPRHFRKQAQRRCAPSTFFPFFIPFASYLFPLSVSFVFSFLFLFENTLEPKIALRLRNDLQSSTPEEYLNRRVLADKAGLGDGPVAVKSDGALSTQSGIDDRRNLLLLFQRLFFLSEKASRPIFAERPWLSTLQRINF